jgi:hypothetical protein
MNDIVTKTHQIGDNTNNNIVYSKTINYFNKMNNKENLGNLEENILFDKILWFIKDFIKARNLAIDFIRDFPSSPNVDIYSQIIDSILKTLQINDEKDANGRGIYSCIDSSILNAKVINNNEDNFECNKNVENILHINDR